MVARFLLVKLASSDAQGKAALVADARAVVARSGVRIGKPADEKSAASWDLGLTIEGRDVAEVDAVLADALVDRWLQSLRAAGAVIKTWVFEV